MANARANLDQLHSDIDDFDPDVIIVGSGSAGAAPQSSAR